MLCKVILCYVNCASVWIIFSSHELFSRARKIHVVSTPFVLIQRQNNCIYTVARLSNEILRWSECDVLSEARLCLRKLFRFYTDAVARRTLIRGHWRSGATLEWHSGYSLICTMWTRGFRLPTCVITHAVANDTHRQILRSKREALAQGWADVGPAWARISPALCQRLEFAGWPPKYWIDFKPDSVILNWNIREINFQFVWYHIAPRNTFRQIWYFIRYIRQTEYSDPRLLRFFIVACFVLSVSHSSSYLNVKYSWVQIYYDPG